jgi:hypothetical protein
MKFKIEVIDKNKAIELLRANGANRRIKDGIVLKYAQDMKDGKWVLGPDPIVISVSGRILNGQHRLWAIEHSDTKQLFSVCRECSSEAFCTIDGGVPRNFTDRIVINRNENGKDSLPFNERNYIASVKSFVECPFIKNSWQISWTIPSFEIVEPKIRRYLVFASEAIGATGESTRMRRASVLAAIGRAAYSGVDKDALREFARVLVYAGESKVSGDAGNKYVRKVRDWVMLRKGAGGGSASSALYFNITRAIDCFVNKLEVKNLPKDGFSEDIYPLKGDLVNFVESVKVDWSGIGDGFRARQNELLSTGV